MSSRSEEEVAILLNGFQCSRDHDREDFLHNKAILFEKKGMARTYLALVDGEIAGYFTLSIRRLRVPEDQAVSRSLSKKMNIDPDNSVAQSYLLGRLGRGDDSYRGMGADLLEDAVELVKQANGIVGCRVVRVDCQDELIPYYEQHGFRYLCVTEPVEGKLPLNHLVLVI